MTGVVQHGRPSWRVAVDIGGTFTDVAAFDPASGRVVTGKALSTPRDLVDGVVVALAKTAADPSEIELLVHGSTVVINALIERKGAQTALITTRGFRDVYEIGRINRPDSFNLFFRKHTPLVPREHVYEVDERLLPDGSVLRALDLDDAGRVIDDLEGAGVGAVAIAFLHGYKDPTHEVAMRDLVQARLPGAFVTASHEISREYREFERTSTTVANAFVGPRVSKYLSELDSRLDESGFEGRVMIMQSNGGLVSLDRARRNCVQMMESGPAGGVVGAIAVAGELGIDNVICFDMGGTTAKACVVQGGAASLSADYFVGGYGDGLPIRVPVLDIKEIGTGGGSIAWLDGAGALHVGPESSGAEPGPAAYGNGGTQPTVTDAHVLLGRLSPERFLGGDMALDLDAAIAAFDESIATPPGMSVAESALGVLAIADAQMANAVRAVTTERGLDPRDFALVAYGGAGPMHAVEVARDLGIEKVIVPLAPGHFSAWGMLSADLRLDFARTDFIRLEGAEAIDLEELFLELEAEAREAVTEIGVGSGGIVIERSADMRYVGQEHAVTLGLPAKIDDLAVVKALFDDAHERLYSHGAPEEAAEFVTARVSALGVLAKPRWSPLESSETGDGRAAEIEVREIAFGSSTEPLASRIVDRRLLRAGDVVRGPAIIEEEASLTLLDGSSHATVDAFGHLLITLEPE
jgi:N-methylhydantoinase A